MATAVIPAVIPAVIKRFTKRLIVVLLILIISKSSFRIGGRSFLVKICDADEANDWKEELLSIRRSLDQSVITSIVNHRRLGGKLLRILRRVGILHMRPPLLQLVSLLTFVSGVFILLLVLSGDVELNPGPNYRHPCGKCDAPVKRNQKGICCDDCSSWYHTSCIVMSDERYYQLGSSDEKWVCEWCIHTESSLHSSSAAFSSFEESNNDYSFDQVVGRSGGGMLFCHLNVRSLYSCMDDIQDLLNCDCGRVFFSLSETWLNDSIPDGMVAVPGFTLHRKDRSERGGGVAMYCPDGFRCYRRSDLEVDALEVLWTEVKVHRGKSVLVCSVYRSPTGGCFGNFVEQFSVMLENAVLEGKEIIVLGDLNVNLLVDSPANRHMTSVCRELKLTQMISVPTRITENSRTLIDHVYVTNPQGFSESGCIDVGISDHLMVFTIKKGDQSCGHKIHKARSFKRCEVDAMLADLKAAPWKCDATDINHRWSHWKEVFLNVVDRHAPIVSCRIRRDTPPWLSSDCRKLMKKRNRIHRLAMRTGSSDMWDSYRCLKNRVTGAVRGAKRTYFESLMSSTSGPTGRMWRQINRLLGKVNSGGTVLSGENFVQSFCDHLTMVTEANVSSDAMLPLPTLMKRDSVFHLQPVQEDDVLAELCGLNITKATGLDNISARLLRLSAPAIAASLCDLYNFSISACQIPKEWKEAKIIPIPKSANAGVDVEQFRPISILPIVSKVLESLIHSQVYSYIQEAGILNEVQSGFRHGYCAQDALLRTVDDWRSGLDENKVVGVVFVDLRKAFDSIDHGLLLRKLAQYGIAGSSLKWFECYLSERRQRVVVGDEFSRWVAVRSGVPQGSILGPLLFNIFVNDLPDVVQTSKIMLYADDTTLYYGSSCMS